MARACGEYRTIDHGASCEVCRVCLNSLSHTHSIDKLSHTASRRAALMTSDFCSFDYVITLARVLILSLWISGYTKERLEKEVNGPI